MSVLSSLGNISARFTLDISDLSTNLKLAEESIKNAESKFSGFTDIGNRVSGVGKKMTLGLTLPIAGVGAAITKMGMDFEAAMSEVGAISNASAEDMAKLEEKAKEMGSTTKFSASQSAEALKYMAMAGWDTTKMVDGLSGVMNLAAASGEELGTVADIVTDAMTAFGIEASRSSEFADILAAASSNANTNVGILGESFKYVAPVAGALGYTAEDTAFALGLMANAGIKGSQSGTSLRTMMTRLLNPTDAMSELMHDLGLSMTDAEGKMKPLHVVMEDLREGFKTLDPAQQAVAASTLAGREAMSGLLAIVNAGESDFHSLSDAINNSNGVAENMANQMNDNLGGQLTLLKSQLEGVAIQLFEHLVPALTKVVEFVGKVVGAFANLSPRTQGIIVTLAGIVAAIGPLLVIVGTLISAVGTISAAFTAASGAIAAAGGALAILTGPVAIVIGVIAGLIAIGVLLYKNWGTIKEVTVSVWESIKEFFSSLWEWMQDFFGKWGVVILAVLAPFLGVPLLIYKHWDDIKKMLSTLWESMKKIVGSIFTSVKNFLDELWNKIKNTTIDTWNAIKSTVINIITSIVKWVNNTFEEFFKTIRNILNNIMDIFKNTWELIKTIVLGIVLLMINLITGDFTQFKEDLDKLLTKLKDIIINIWNTIKETVMLIATGLISFVIEAWEAFKSIMEKITTSLKDALVKTWEAFKTFLSKTWENIVNNTKAAWENLKNKVHELSSSAKETAVNVFNALLSFFRELPGKLMTIGSNMFTSMKDGVLSTINTVYTTILNGVTKAIDWLKKLPSQAMSWGVDFIAGFASGITSRLRNLLDTVRETARRIADTVRRTLRISSPSKVMQEIGAYTADGLIKGIGDKQGQLTNTVSKMMNVTDMMNTSKANPFNSSKTVTNSTSNSDVKNITLNVTQNISDRKTADYATDSIVKVFQGRGLKEAFI